MPCIIVLNESNGSWNLKTAPEGKQGYKAKERKKDRYFHRLLTYCFLQHHLAVVSTLVDLIPHKYPVATQQNTQPPEHVSDLCFLDILMFVNPRITCIACMLVYFPFSLCLLIYRIIFRPLFFGNTFTAVFIWSLFLFLLLYIFTRIKYLVTQRTSQ